MGGKEDNVCKLAIYIQLKVLYREVSGNLLQYSRHYAHSTEAPSTASLPFSRWYSVMVNNPLSMSIVLFGILLLHLNSRHIKTTFLCPMCSLQVTKLIHEDMTQ